MAELRVVQSGEFLYLGNVSPSARGSVAVETRSVLEQLQSALMEAGSSLDDVVSVLVFIRAAADFQPMNDAYRYVLDKGFSDPDDDRLRDPDARCPGRDERRGGEESN